MRGWPFAVRKERLFQEGGGSRRCGSEVKIFGVCLVNVLIAQRTVGCTERVIIPNSVKIRQFGREQYR